jgi:predicted DNA-binding transcriptional regulator AlpA
MEARYLSPERVVVYLCLSSLKALYGLVARKQIPYTRLGNRTLRFDRVELELWLAQRTTKVASVRPRALKAGSPTSGHSEAA